MTAFFELPEWAEIDGKKYAFNTGFPVWLRVGEIIASPMAPERAIPKLLSLCFEEKPANMAEAARAIAEFYKGAFPAYGRGDGSGAAFSPEWDRGIIYSGFMKCYGIDIFRTPLHWYRFVPLLLELSDCLFSKVMACRSSDSAALRDMFRLPVSNPDGEFADTLFAAFGEV